MSTFRNRRFLAAAATAVIAITAGSGIAAQAAPRPGANDRPAGDTVLANSFSAVDRNTSWSLKDKLKLDFPTHHPQGIAYTEDHIFLRPWKSSNAPSSTRPRRTGTTGPPGKASATCS